MTTSASRHEARERALSLGYEAEMKSATIEDVLAALDVAPDSYAVDLLERYGANRPDIEARIDAATHEWSLDRLAVIDRLVLALAVTELLDPDGPPTAVVIDEAVELAKTYSTENSGGFVNGVLSTIAAQVRR